MKGQAKGRGGALKSFSSLLLFIQGFICHYRIITAFVAQLSLYQVEKVDVQNTERQFDLIQNHVCAPVHGTWDVNRI